jgi:uncharacterized small protein (TIGR04563 family)
MERATEKKKQSFYMSVGALEEIQAEATRQDRSMSWVMQQAWRLAREQVKKLPGSMGA